MLIQKNKKAYFDYTVIKSFKAGIVLSGDEVKSLRTNGCNFQGAYVSFFNNDGKFNIFLKNVSISKYRFSSSKDFDEKRDRGLLLHKRECNYIERKTHDAGITVIPLGIHTDGNLIKVEIALAKGNKKYDKREIIKKRDIERKELRFVKIR